MHTANTTTLYSTVIQWKEAIKGKKEMQLQKEGCVSLLQNCQCALVN